MDDIDIIMYSVIYDWRLELGLWHTRILLLLYFITVFIITILLCYQQYCISKNRTYWTYVYYDMSMRIYHIRSRYLIRIFIFLYPLKIRPAANFLHSTHKQINSCKQQKWLVYTVKSYIFFFFYETLTYNWLEHSFSAMVWPITLFFC